MKILLTILFLTWASLAHGLTVAAYNSPESWRAKADVICNAKGAAKVLQAAADQCERERDELELAPGFYLIDKTLTIRCGVKGVGDARLSWIGDKKPDGFVVHLRGRGGTLHKPHFRGVGFDGDYKIGGLLVDDVHHAEVANLSFYRHIGHALRVNRGWHVYVQNVAITYCRGCSAFEAETLSLGTVYGLSAGHVQHDGPIVTISGTADVRQLGLANCDAGKHPVLHLRKFWVGHLTGYSTEQNKGTHHLLIEDSIGARIGGLTHWQNPDNPMPVGVEIRDCENTVVERVDAHNISGSIFRMDQRSLDRGCCVDRVRENYGKNAGVQPKHIIEITGRGASE